jgi:carbon starvation protein CstA
VAAAPAESLLQPFDLLSKFLEAFVTFFFFMGVVVVVRCGSLQFGETGLETREGLVEVIDWEGGKGE